MYGDHWSTFFFHFADTGYHCILQPCSWTLLNVKTVDDFLKRTSACKTFSRYMYVCVCACQAKWKKAQGLFLCVSVCLNVETAMAHSYGCNMWSLCGGTGGERKFCEGERRRKTLHTWSGGSQKCPVQLAGMYLLCFIDGLMFCKTWGNNCSDFVGCHAFVFGRFKTVLRYKGKSLSVKGDMKSGWKAFGQIFQWFSLETCN